ncbi:excinuclease ABC subunit UvrC [Candidatus Levibacter sp. Uisw_134_01]|uniref:excinuclease ABC subunit UvrC n=1 Tax=Candidatus Levibacter sp. Uisw_134_01 TaxID=3230999 RepID=UPI003D48957B
MIKNKKISLNDGIEVIKSELITIPSKPGIYQMIGENEEYLYIGKAKNLKNRVTFYTKPKRLNSRLTFMVSNTKRMEIIITSSEMEALLLESNLIKKFEPTYNILLKDDKSFSSIFFNLSHPFPQLSAHRGTRSIKGEYFGPFVSKRTIYKTIETLQKAFLLRTCNDNMFKSRTRPCLQFQIKRCSAPCVNLISKESYEQSLYQAKNFLLGKSKEIKENLINKMYEASNHQNFEAAAIYRNRVKALTEVTANQNINIPNINDADFLVLKKIENKVVVQMNIIRNGSSYGSKAYFPNIGKNAIDVNDNEIMQAFICQFYDKNVPATNILVNQNPKDKILIEKLLSKKHGIKVKIDLPQRGKKLEIINSALKNAAENLNRKIFEKTSNKNNLNKIKTIFRFENDLNKIEIYDNSHHQGKSPIGAMVAFNEDGFSKSLYRRYNINLEYNKNSNNKTEVHNNNNDYLMMEEVIKRRFKGKNIIHFPDLLIIDGGKGHLNTVLSVLKKIKVKNVEVLAISKGLDRDAGRENFYTKNMNNFKFNKDDPTLFFLQNLRDEVHRYAIAGHRLKSKKALLKSPLDEIVGIGANRKKSLLEEFGSAKAVGSASLEDLLKVDGINKSIANNIFNFFN